MDSKIMLIINPAAGRGVNKAGIFGVIEILNRFDQPVAVYMTKKRGDASEYALKYAKDHSLVVCCGGDGTLNETVNGLLNIKEDCEIPPLGYIPVGTANDVATTLGLPKTPAKAAELIMNGHIMGLDVGVFKEKYFTYIAAFGAFTGASYQTPQQSKNALGHFAYMIEGLRYITQIIPIRLSAKWDGGEVEGEFLFGSVSNSTSVAGLLKIKPDLVKMDDGLFEVMLIRKPANIMQLERIINGIVKQNYDSQYVEFFHTSKIAFSFNEEVAWTMDGENGGKHREIELKIKPSAVKLLVPDRRKKAR